MKNGLKCSYVLFQNRTKIPCHKCTIVQKRKICCSLYCKLLLTIKAFLSFRYYLILVVILVNCFPLFYRAEDPFFTAAIPQCFKNKISLQFQYFPIFLRRYPFQFPCSDEKVLKSSFHQKHFFIIYHPLLQL